MTIERIPPTNIEAEEACLGSLLLDGGVEKPSLLGQVTPILAARHFYRTAHRTVFEAMVRLEARGEPVDAVLVYRELEYAGALNETVTRELLVHLAECVNTPAHAAHYADLVKEAALRREGVVQAFEVLDSAYEGDAKPSELAARLRAGSEAIEEGLAGEIEGWSAGLVDEAFDRLIKPPQLEHSTEFLSWGIKELDDIGFIVEPGSYTVLAAWTGNGKSTLACQWAFKTAMRIGRPILYVSLEMPPIQLVRKAILNESGVDDPNFNPPDEDDIYFLKEGRDHVRRAAVCLPERVPRKLSRFLEWLYGMQAKVKPAATIIDHMGLLQGRGSTIYERITDISRSLRTFSLNQQEIPLMALCQLSREGKKSGRAPDLPDLRDSGAIEEDASNVLMLWYPWGCASKKARNDGTVPKQQAWLFVRKNRNGEAHRKIELHFDGAKGRLTPVSPEPEHAPQEQGQKLWNDS